MNVGYARALKDAENLRAQIDALTKDGCEEVFIDNVSGIKDDLPEFEKALNYCRPGDALTVWRLDQIGEGLSSLLEILNNMQCRGVQLRSLSEGIDTTTAIGKSFFLISSAFSAYEREIALEQAISGTAADIARGKLGGRPRKVSPEMEAQGRSMFLSGDFTIDEVCKTLGISRGTFYVHKMHKDLSRALASFT